MKTFEDLKFEANETGMHKAIENFDNGYGIDVLSSRPSHNEDDVDAVAVLNDAIKMLQEL